MAGQPWVEAILMAKMKDWSWEMKMCEKEIEGKGARPWLGRVVIQMKLEAYETCIFFLYPNAHLLATSYNRASEWDRESVRGRQQSHMKREWGYIFHFSAAILSHQNHNHLKVWPTILAYCEVLSAPLCFDRTKRYAVL